MSNQEQEVSTTETVTKPTRARKTTAKAKTAKAKTAKAKTAKAKVTKAKTNGEAGRFEALALCRTEYTGGTSAVGNKTLNCGDEVAQMFDGKTLDQVYATVAKRAKVDEKDLRKFYGHLNAGMQRMNLGNKLRAVLRAKEAA